MKFFSIFINVIAGNNFFLFLVLLYSVAVNVSDSCRVIVFNDCIFGRGKGVLLTATQKKAHSDNYNRYFINHYLSPN